MSSFPLFVYPLAAAVGASLLVGLAYLLFERSRNPIDMTGLTADDRAEATPEETLERAERLQVDPAKLTTAEIQRAHRTLAQEMATRPAGLYVPHTWVGER